MPSKMLRLLAMEWSTAVQYRTDLFLWSLTEAAVPLISLAVWYRVAQGNPNVTSPRDILSYYIMVIFINFATSAWSGYFLSRQILNGDIVQYLIRPLSVFYKYIANNLMEKALRLVVPVPIFIIFVSLFPHFFSPALFVPLNILLFIISLILAAIIAFTLDMNIGLLAFWLEDVNQLRSYKFFLQEITSGTMIPFALFPAALQFGFSFLPFRFIISAPAEILLQQTHDLSVIQLLSIQFGWAIGLTILLGWLWKRGLKNYAVPGQ